MTEPVFANPATQLYHGDCIDIMREMPPQSIDMVLTAPPYGMAYRSNHRAEQFDIMKNDDSIPFALTQDFISESSRLLKDTGALYVFTNFEMLSNVTKIIKEEAASLKLGNTIVWCKNNWSAGALESDWACRTELIVYARKSKHKLIGDRPSNVLDFKRVSQLHHPTEKPVELLEYLISKSCPKEGVILDPFCGSGSSLEASVKTRRKAIGIEIDDKYVNASIKRLKSISVCTFPDITVAPFNFTMETTSESV